MSRTKKQKFVSLPPGFTIFKPKGIPAKDLECINLTLDEYEAIKLADFKAMDHLEASQKMEISRSTFSRLIEKARKKTALMLVEGRTLTIGEGNIHFRHNIIYCKACKANSQIELNTSLDKCPACGSKDIISLAGTFGHGPCCSRHKRNL